MNRFCCSGSTILKSFTAFFERAIFSSGDEPKNSGGAPRNVVDGPRVLLGRHDGRGLRCKLRLTPFPLGTRRTTIKRAGAVPSLFCHPAQVRPQDTRHFPLHREGSSTLSMGRFTFARLAFLKEELPETCKCVSDELRSFLYRRGMQD